MTPRYARKRTLGWDWCAIRWHDSNGRCHKTTQGYHKNTPLSTMILDSLFKICHSQHKGDHSIRFYTELIDLELGPYDPIEAKKLYLGYKFFKPWTN